MRALLPLALSLAVSAVPAATPRPMQSDALIVVGPLIHHRATNALFHIDGLWMRVQPGTMLHRWLLTGTGRTAAVGVTLEPDRYGDQSNIRIMTGRLLHAVDPTTSPFVHAFVLRDPKTQRYGAVMFETKDRFTWEALDAWSDLEVSLVVQIRPE